MHDDRHPDARPALEPAPAPAWAEPVRREPHAAPPSRRSGGRRSTPASSGRAAASCRGFGRTSGPATGEGPSWDDVEETLIAGDVGAALAIDLVERARKRRDAGGPEAAIRAELAALLVAARPRLEPALGGRRRPGGRARRRRQRDRQDDDDRQARQPLRGRGSLGHPRRRRHVPRRGHRPAPDLGRPGQGPDGRPRPGRRSRARSSTTRSTPPSPAAPTWSSPTPPAGSTPART